MATRKTNRGQVIDMDALISSSNPRSSAVGNMGTNATGDKLGPGGTIKQKSEDRVREYYEKNPRSSTSKQSLKGTMPQTDASNVRKQDVPKTAKTEKENARVTKRDVDTKREQMKKELIPDVAEPDEFDAPMEPLGYKEVEQENGDIELVPYYKEEDA